MRVASSRLSVRPARLAKSGCGIAGIRHIEADSIGTVVSRAASGLEGVEVGDLKCWWKTWSSEHRGYEYEKSE